MSIRPFVPSDHVELQRLARLLAASDDDYDFQEEQLFVFDRGNRTLGGYISVSARPWSEGSESQPVAYVEGWYVECDLQRSGIGTNLMIAAERWALLNGLAEICSDAEIGNKVSLAAHRRLEFEPTIQLQYFRKSLV